MIVAPGSIRYQQKLSLSHVLGVLLRTVFQEYLTARYRTILGLGTNRHVGTGGLGVSTAGDNDLGGIGPQLLRMAVDSEVGQIYKTLLLPYHEHNLVLLLVGKFPQ